MKQQESSTRTESDAFGELQVRRLQIMHVQPWRGTLKFLFRFQGISTGELRLNGTRLPLSFQT